MFQTVKEWMDHVWEALGTELGGKAGPDPRSPVGAEGEEGLVVFKS